MPDNGNLEPMLEMYLFETSQLIDQLEQIAMDSEAEGSLAFAIPEIFRIMHTIKGNSMMMMFDGIANLAHIIEDLFDYLRQHEEAKPNYEQMTDLLLEAIDYIKSSVTELESGGDPLPEPKGLVDEIKQSLESLQFMSPGGEEPPEDTQDKEEEETTQRFFIAPAKTIETNEQDTQQTAYEVRIHFEPGSEMENIRAFSVIHSLKDQAQDILHLPQNIVESDQSKEFIIQNGFMILFRTGSDRGQIEDFFNSVAFLDQLEIREVDEEEFASIASMYSDDVETVDQAGQGDQAESSTPVSSGEAEPQDHEDQTDTTPPYQGSTTESDLVDQPTETAAQPPVQPQPHGTLEMEMPLAAQSAPEPPMEKVVAKAAPDIPAGEKSRSKSGDKGSKQNFISVGISRVDKLMDLVGELVVSESMVTRNPDLTGLELENFDKAVRQHRMIINEIQDVVMSVRMMPLALTFQKMSRLVRDMKKKIGKDVELEIIGQETEVDKNVIERIGDPLMHIIRNSIDHGLEANEDRQSLGKTYKGKVVLEAKHSGGDVWISVKDDGRGLDTERILDKAERRGLMHKSREEYSRKEVYNFLFEPGFSTKEQVTEFSGRGVGLDVVARNVEELGGTIVVDSELGTGTEFGIRIPLTLAIIDGMMMSVGKSIFTLPITAIKESFDARDQDIIVDPEGNEMCMIRGTCYPIVRLHDRFGLHTDIQEIKEGILIMTEYDAKTVLLFVDAILGEQQVVVKSLSQFLEKVRGISGCALLGDGRISLILDPSGLVD